MDLYSLNNMSEYLLKMSSVMCYFLINPWSFYRYRIQQSYKHRVSIVGPCVGAFNWRVCFIFTFEKFFDLESNFNQADINIYLLIYLVLSYRTAFDRYKTSI